MVQPANADPHETDKFGRLATDWWNPNGPMHSLHAINPLRTRYIVEHAAVGRRRVLDIGCGGGLLAESLARSGAEVTGIDLSADLLGLARRHAREQGLEIAYCEISAEELASQQPGGFDVIACMEMLEHVPHPEQVVASCARLLRRGGHAFFSTLDRTLRSFFFAIVGAEYILRLLPAGSHRYRSLIRPAELRMWARDNQLAFADSAGVVYNPLTGKFRIAGRQDINYIMHFTRE